MTRDVFTLFDYLNESIGLKSDFFLLTVAIINFSKLLCSENEVSDKIEQFYSKLIY